MLQCPLWAPDLDQSSSVEVAFCASRLRKTYCIGSSDSKALKIAVSLVQWFLDRRLYFQLLSTINHPTFKMSGHSPPLTTYTYIARSMFSTSYVHPGFPHWHLPLSSQDSAAQPRAALNTCNCTYDYLFVSWGRVFRCYLATWSF